jgi:hypothetical protein
MFNAMPAGAWNQRMTNTHDEHEVATEARFEAFI